MSRPTLASQHEQAEQWMLTTFGHRMGDYLKESRREPLGLAVVWTVSSKPRAFGGC